MEAAVSVQKIARGFLERTRMRKRIERMLKYVGASKAVQKKIAASVI